MSFEVAGSSDAEDAITSHWHSLSGPTDAFLEAHVRESKHYFISMSGARAGFASIHGGQQREAKTARKKLALAKPPRAGRSAVVLEDYTDRRKIRDRELFA